MTETTSRMEHAEEPKLESELNCLDERLGSWWVRRGPAGCS